MSEHVIVLCERILSESRERPVTPLADEPLTIRVRECIDRWYEGRAFLAAQAKRLWERADTAKNEVARLREHITLLEANLGSDVAVKLARQHTKEAVTNGE